MLINLTVAAVKAALLTGLASIPNPQKCDSPQAVYEVLSGRYDLTDKVDSEETKVLVRARSKNRHAVYRTISKEVDFTWKDREAARRRGENVWRFAIGNVDPGFAQRICRMSEAMELEGFELGITRAFADVYRQHIATATAGKKASDDGSYHGSRPELGPGKGEAIDIVTLNGHRGDFYAWVDRYGPPEFGVGRPYGNGDPPHVGPTNGKEYLAHHSVEHTRVATVQHPHRSYHRRRYAAR
jgi:hypothetical protein